MTTRSLRQDFKLGQEAYRRGDVLLSYRILRSMDLEGKAPPKEYYQILSEVTQAAEHLMAQWLKEALQSQDEGDFPSALNYYDDLLAALPADDPLHKQVLDRAEPVREKLKEHRRELGKLIEEARAEFKAGRIEASRLKLIEARERSYRLRLEFPLEQERLLAECDRRVPAPVVELSEVEAPVEKEDPKEVAVAKVEPEKRRPRRRRRHWRHRPRPRRRSAVIKKKKTESKPEPATKEYARDSESDKLLAKASALRREKRWAEAIVTYRRVLRLDPRNPQAKKGLAQLKPERDRMIARWMKQAGKFFAREQLEKAAPLYRRVLQIDPGNLRAKEGLQMYQRLIEIKNKQK